MHYLWAAYAIYLFVVYWRNIDTKEKQ
jgi:hypothetical protein